jgi:glutamate racemase
MSGDARKPIGVFDSGIGGLTVVHELVTRLPNEEIVYLGDTARLPYGTKSPETVLRFSRENLAFLKRRNVKIIVVACNTTKARRIGVIGTTATIRSGAYERALWELEPRIKIWSRACPLFVPLVEEGWHEDEITYLTARRYLSPMADFGADTLVLGCTHYPVIRDVLARVIGPGVTLVDSAHETAAEVERVLEQENLRSNADRPGTITVYVTDIPYLFKEVGERFLRRPMEHVERVDLDVVLVPGGEGRL